MRIYKNIFLMAFVLLFAATRQGSAYAETRTVQNTLTADDISYNTNTGDATAKGNVVVTRDGATLRGNEAFGNTEAEEMTISGDVSGDFPKEGATLSARRAKWTGDKSKNTDGVVEAFGSVRLTREPNDRLNAEYIRWEAGTQNYSARGGVDGVISAKIIKADAARRTGDNFWATGVRRFEDTVEKYTLSARRVEGRLGTDKQTGDEIVEEMTADGNVVLDYVDKDGLKTRVTGERAIYSKARGTIVIAGNTKAVRNDGKTVTADTMVVHEDTRVIEAKGNSKIIFVVQEEEKEKSGDKKEAPRGGVKGAANGGASENPATERQAARDADDAAKDEPRDGGASADGEPDEAEETSLSTLTDAEREWVEEQ